MQKSVFAHFGVGFGQEGVAGSVAANFSTALNSFKAALSMVRHSVSGLFKGARAVNSTPSKAVNSAFSGVRAVSALSRARVVNSTRASSLSLSLSLSRSISRIF